MRRRNTKLFDILFKRISIIIQYYGKVINLVAYFLSEYIFKNETMVRQGDLF